MGKFEKILKLSDPYPNLGYEILCYVKALLGTFFLILSIFLIFYPLLFRVNFFGLLETGLSPTGLRILAFFDTIVWPGGYLGFLFWGLLAFLLGLWFFWRIKLVRKIFKKG